ncbi:unnamed protein product [Owenia fusiformis]|uniref:Uncharacterized protein n=1 Tax=Owenia fusiformis TaxID=6347 RepID=A0A8J1TYZ1_OWEFU|nr:unnamed protein product [Owenia fusiformis]
MGDLSNAVRDTLRDVLLKVKKAVVFIDDSSAECLHWNLGVIELFKAGALAVKQFSSFESGGKEAKKAVFLISSPLEGTALDILHDILSASSFQYVIVIVTGSVTLQGFCRYGSSLGDKEEAELFPDYQDQLLEWMGNMNYTAEVLHRPINIAPVTKELFLLPSHSQLYPLLDTDLPHIVKTQEKSDGKAVVKSLEDVEHSHLPKDYLIQLRSLVDSVNGLLEILKVQEECYYIGNTSKLVASSLAAYQPAKNRRKNAQAKASIVFMDRSLDLALPGSHSMETLLDRVLNQLPNLPAHSTDVSINMHSLTDLHPNIPEDSCLVSGCLAQPGDSTAISLLNTMATAKQKEALMEVNRRLVESASTSGLPVKLDARPGRVSANTLESHVQLFRNNPDAIESHAGVLQLALATIQSLNGKESTELVRLEKLLLQSIDDDSSPSGYMQLHQTVTRQTDMSIEDREVSFDDVIVLLVWLHSIAGNQGYRDIEEVNQLKEALIIWILEGGETLPEVIAMQVEETRQSDKDVLEDVLDDVFTQLHAVGKARQNLKQNRSLLSASTMTAPASYKPLIKQLLGQIFDPAKPDLLDVHHKSSAFKDLLKSGFGYFMNVSKPRPNEHGLLILYIIGGTTTAELKLAKDTVASYNKDIKVLVGSDQLLKSKDVLSNLFSHLGTSALDT